MGCGLDTRPAALACLRIIIAALNILIAVSDVSLQFLIEWNIAQVLYGPWNINSHSTNFLGTLLVLAVIKLFVELVPFDCVLLAFLSRA